MRIGVVGAGGVGGHLAARWTEAERDVVLIARGPHLERIRSEGLRLLSPLGDAVARPETTDDMAALASADLVLFAVKTWQLPAALEATRPHLRPSAAIFGLQNGVESPEVMRGAHPAENVLAGTCRVISRIERPGVIRHVAVAPTITFGEIEGGVSDRCLELERLLRVPDKLSADASGDVMSELWRKLLFFAPVSGIGSLTRCPIGTFRTVPETRRMLEAAVGEVATLGRAVGVTLETGAERATMAFIDGLVPEGTSSMQRDFAAGRRTELESLSGFVSGRGATLGVPTPTHDFMYAALLPQELEAREAWLRSAGA